MKGSKYFRVDVPVTDLWSKPKFESSRENQIVFGEEVEKIRKYNNFYYIITKDLYKGWVNKDHLTETLLQSNNGKKVIVNVPIARIYKIEKSKSHISMLSFGSIVRVHSKIGRRTRLVCSDGWIDSDSILKEYPATFSINNLIRTLKLFIGVPYLWGGRSGFGLDCSGYVQLVYSYFGISLPRDTKDQIKSGKKVSMKKVQAGDLIYSPGHVVVYIGSGKIIHSSLKAGGVKIESVNPDDDNYRKDISEEIITARRVT